MSTEKRSKKVKVWVRTRPTARFAGQMIDMKQDGKTIDIHCTRDPKKGVVNNQIIDWAFKVDGFLHNSSQEQVFDSTTSNIVSGALNGYNGTLMCYGQTGAGKTFTMTGATENYKHRGIIPRAISQLYHEIEQRQESAINIRISYLEIYNETMFDLLSTLPQSMNMGYQPQLNVVEVDNVIQVKGLSCHLAHNEEEALNLLFEGETNRAIANHTLNKHSSRSHCIFTIHIENRSRVQSEAKYTLSKLNFVDLAGSERIGKTKSEGKTQQEALYINKSLTFLEQTVISLADKNREHIPFRQSKLTHYLKDSVGGKCNTLLVANVWGEAEQIEETISTLRFASRMMRVASEPSVNEQYDATTLVKKLESEICALKNELAMHDTLKLNTNNRSLITYDPLSEQQRYDIRTQVRQYLDGSLDEIDIVNIRQIQGVFEAFKEITSDLEKEIESKLRAKYTLIDKSDAAAIAAAQQAGVAIGDDGELLGELDGQSSGVGPAAPGTRMATSSVANIKRKELKKSRKERSSPGPKTTSPVVSTKGGVEGSISATPSVEKKEEREDAGTPSSSIGGAQKVLPPKPSTPPTRQQAFEDFKKKTGYELNKTLTDNKEILAGKKKEYADLAREINTIKRDIDSSRLCLDNMKKSREAQGIPLQDEEEVIISEEEYLEINKLKDLKGQYKTNFEELKNVKTDVQYCQKLVDQCRQRLVQEFDTWYNESFLNPEEAKSSAEVGIGVRAGTQIVAQNTTVGEDEQEKFERLQKALLMENPDSAAFYNAKMRTQRRKTYEMAMMQTQPTSGSKPWTPTRHIRNLPPNSMIVQS